MDARRILIPLLPMALAFWSVVISTMAFCSLVSLFSILTLLTMAGESALVMYISGMGEYSIQSIFSSLSSAETALIRTPLCPTAAPIGSTLSWSVLSAILALSPGIREEEMISTAPSWISGTSFSISFSRNLGEVLVSSRNIPYCGSILTKRRRALRVSPTLKLSPLIRFL